MYNTLNRHQSTPSPKRALSPIHIVTDMRGDRLQEDDTYNAKPSLDSAHGLSATRLCPPQTPQAQQLPRWPSPALDHSLPSFSNSPFSPSSPESPVSPIVPVFEQSKKSRVPTRQSSLKRTSSRRMAIPEHVGDLAVGKLIGHGSFSQTFQAYNSTSMYAVKVRLPSTNPALFEHERSVLATLTYRNQHDQVGSENVVKYYPELSEVDHSVFWLYDTSLDNLVRSPQFQVDPNSLDFFDFRIISQPLVGVQNWVDWARQLKHGLEFIHSQGIVHADLKPDNVLVDTHGNQLVIADFSGAIDINKQPASVLAKDLIEGFAWSPVYTDPQVRKQTSLPSFRSDIYALGLVLAFMATGVEPYSTAKNATQRLLWMDKIKPLDSFDPDVMPRLTKVRPVIKLLLDRSFDGVDKALAIVQ